MPSSVFICKYKRYLGPARSAEPAYERRQSRALATVQTSAIEMMRSTPDASRAIAAPWRHRFGCCPPHGAAAAARLDTAARVAQGGPPARGELPGGLEGERHGRRRSDGRARARSKRACYSRPYLTLLCGYF